MSEDMYEGMSSGPSNDDTKFDVIPPSDVGKVEYCIALATKVLELLYRPHGDTCKPPGCDQPLEFRDMNRGTCLVVN